MVEVSVHFQVSRLPPTRSPDVSAGSDHRVDREFSGGYLSDSRDHNAPVMDRSLYSRGFADERLAITTYYPEPRLRLIYSSCVWTRTDADVVLRPPN